MSNPARPLPPADLWPGLTVIAPLTGGARNTVWRARDAAGSDWVLKSTSHRAEALEWLVPLHAAARSAGFVVPQMAWRPVQTAASGAASGHVAGWTCEPFLPGATARPADLTTLAPRLARLHACAAALPPRPDLPGACDAPLPADLSPDLVRALRAALAPMAGAPVGAIHGDLNPGNLLFTPEGPALIDWDEARRDWLFLDQIATRPPTPAEARAALAVEILSCLGPEPDRAAELTQRLLRAPPPEASPAAPPAQE